jgi:hypothetical protein
MSNNVKSYAKTVLDGYDDTLSKLTQRYNSAVAVINREHNARLKDINEKEKKCVVPQLKRTSWLIPACSVHCGVIWLIISITRPLVLFDNQLFARNVFAHLIVLILINSEPSLFANTFLNCGDKDFVSIFSVNDLSTVVLVELVLVN